MRKVIYGAAIAALSLMLAAGLGYQTGLRHGSIPSTGATQAPPISAEADLDRCVSLLKNDLKPGVTAEVVASAVEGWPVRVATVDAMINVPDGPRFGYRQQCEVDYGAGRRGTPPPARQRFDFGTGWTDWADLSPSQL